MNLFARTAALLPLLIAVGAMAAEGSALSKDSPFNRPGAAGGQTAAANEGLEFAGISSIGKTTDLLFRDKVAKKNHWIAKGETTAGISVLNYDAVRDQAVVKVNGVEKVLTLRKASGPAGPGRTVAAVPTGFNIPTPTLIAAPASPTAVALAPPPAISLPAGPATPETQVKQETEARMLVSDLLEIGMAQRRAYEEKQKQAAGGGSDAAAQTPATDPAGAAPKS